MLKKISLSDIKTKFNALENNIRLAIIVVGVVILWMLSGIFSGNGKEEQIIVERAPKDVQVILVSAEPYSREIMLSGTTEPFMSVNLAARVDGQIENIKLDKGDAVSKGDLLLSIEKEQRTEALEAAKLRLKQAQSLYKAAKNLNKEGYRANTSLDSRRAELAQTKESLKRAENELNFTQISSPINGLVEDRLVEIGDYVKKGDPVYKLVSKDIYKLVAYISQKDRANISVGKEAFATLATGRKVSGIINFIATNAHNITHTYKVEINVLSEEPIPTGMSAKVTMPTAPVSAHFMPYVAMVLNDKGSLGVMVLNEENKVAFHEINPLDDNGKGFYLSGLPAKVKVVVKGQSGLVNDEIVIPHITEKHLQAQKLY